jgi:uncharacterized membrane protein YdjX (TVP38/TMEM64 family)
MGLKEYLLNILSTHVYLGVFLTSIFFPLPYILVISAIHPNFNPFLIGIAGGAGATVGELAAYFLGYGGRSVVTKKYHERLDKLRERFKKQGLLVAFLYSIFPLPTGPVLVPLGMLKFEVRRAILAFFFGKTIVYHCCLCYEV